MSNSILRFDHISYVTRKRTVHLDGYKFKEECIANTKGRFTVMSYGHFDIDMFYYPNGNHDTSIPVEIVAYDFLDKKSDVEVYDKGFICKADENKIDKVAGALRLIGMRSDNDLLWQIDGTLDKEKRYMRIVPQEGISTIPIDSEGYNCPCFFVKNVEDLFDSVNTIKEISLSTVDKLNVNGRDIDVGFMSIDGFELTFEFISLHR